MSSSLTFRWSVLLGAPLVWDVLMLFSSSPYSDVSGELMPMADRWLATEPG